MPPLWLPADVIAYPVNGQSALSSRAVAIVQLVVGVGRGSENWSHLTLASDRPGWEYGAQWPRVGHFPIDASRPYEVWRLAELTDDQRRAILDYARSRVGDWYNMIGLLTGGILGLPHTEVCSEMVGDSYAAARPAILLAKEGQRLLSPDAALDYPSARRIYQHAPKEA